MSTESLQQDSIPKAVQDFRDAEQVDGQGNDEGTTGEKVRSACQRNMSKASNAYDRGGKGYLDEIEKVVRSYDRNNDGVIDIQDVFRIVEDLDISKKNQRFFKNGMIAMTVVAIVLLLCSFGLTIAAVTLTQQMKVTNNGELVNEANGMTVITESKGYVIPIELETEGDQQRLLQGANVSSNIAELTGYTVSMAHVLDAWEALKRGTPSVSVSFLIGEKETHLSINSDSISREIVQEDGRSVTVYEGIKVKDETGTYEVHCLDPCRIYETSGDEFRRLFFKTPSGGEDGGGSCNICYAYEEDCLRKCTNGKCNFVQGNQFYSTHYRCESCFSSVTTVQLENGVTTKMKNLKIGDKVLTNSGFKAVYGFSHVARQREAEFLQIFTDISSKIEPIELTGNHLIFLADKTAPVPASTVKIGDMLETTEGKQAVIKINRVNRIGLFAPFTEDGTIVVNGIKASTYITLPEMGSNFQIYGVDILPMQTVLDMFFSPYRFVCMYVSPELCRERLDDKEGYYGYMPRLALDVMALWMKYPSPAFRFILEVCFITSSFLFSFLFYKPIIISLFLFITLIRKWFWPKKAYRVVLNKEIN